MLSCARIMLALSVVFFSFAALAALGLSGAYGISGYVLPVHSPLISLLTIAGLGLFAAILGGGALHIHLAVTEQRNDAGGSDRHHRDHMTPGAYE